MRATIVFDLDGTLIDSAPDIHAATNALLAEDRLPALTFEQVKSFIGKGVSHLITRVLDAVGEDPQGPRHADFVHRFEARYETAVGLTVVYPGVIAALETLQARGHTLGICTNKPLVPTRAVMDHLNLSRFFSTIIGGDSLPVRKPDPAPLQAALTALGTTAATTLYVGDSEVDAETAQRAGVPFLIFTEGYRKTPVADLPHREAFGSFADLPGLVARAFP